MSTNFNEICRFCLGRETDMSKLHHHGSNIVERVLAFAPSLKICVGDGLPEQACSRCIYRINDCYNFKELCEKSDKSLRQLRTKNVEAKPCIEESKIQNVEQAGNFLEVKVEDIKQEIENCDEIGDEDCLSLSDESLSRSAHDIILPSAETLQNQVHDITSVLPSSSSSKNQHSVQDPLQYLSCRNDMEMDEDNSAMNDNEESDNVPVIRVIIKETEKDEGLFIPGRSKAAYEKEYEKFSAWRKWQNINTTNEEVLLAYFTELSKIFAATSLWCVYSKLKTMLRVREKLDVSSFSDVVSFLKKLSVGHVPKKSNVLSRSQIYEFLLKAPDDDFLLIKLVTAFGVFGACKRQELHDLCFNDVKVEGSVLVVRVGKTNSKPRTFTIVPDGIVNCVALYEKYVALRPKNVKCKNLFIYYKGGKCSGQPVGVNSFGKFPMEIAKFLKLPNPSLYTGHCFRKSSATILKAKQR